MLTAFGKFLRKLRIDMLCTMKEMSDSLGVSVSFLSAVETGKKNIPKTWKDSIIRIYELDEKQQNKLNEAIDQSLNEIVFDLNNLSAKKKNAALIFARKLDLLGDDEVNELIINLNKDKK